MCTHPFRPYFKLHHVYVHRTLTDLSGPTRSAAIRVFIECSRIQLVFAKWCNHSCTLEMDNGRTD